MIGNMYNDAREMTNEGDAASGHHPLPIMDSQKVLYKGRERSIIDIYHAMHIHT